MEITLKFICSLLSTADSFYSDRSWMFTDKDIVIDQVVGMISDSKKNLFNEQTFFILESK